MTHDPEPSFQMRVNGVSFFAGFIREREGAAGRLSIRFDDSKGNSRSTFFNNIGDGDWKEFLVSLDDGYVGDRLFGPASRFTPDHVKTRNSIRAFARELRSDGDLSKEAAMRIEEILRKEAKEFASDNADLPSSTRLVCERISISSMIRQVNQVFHSAGVYVDDPMGLVKNRDTKTFTAFMSRVWSPIMDVMRREIDLKKLDQEPDISPPSP